MLWWNHHWIFLQFRTQFLWSRIVSFICWSPVWLDGMSHCQAHTGEAHCILAYRWGFRSLKDNCSGNQNNSSLLPCLKRSSFFSRLKFIWMDVSSQTRHVCWANWILPGNRLEGGSEARLCERIQEVAGVLLLWTEDPHTQLRARGSLGPGEEVEKMSPPLLHSGVETGVRFTMKEPLEWEKRLNAIGRASPLCDEVSRARGSGWCQSHPASAEGVTQQDSQLPQLGTVTPHLGWITVLKCTSEPALPAHWRDDGSIAHECVPISATEMRAMATSTSGISASQPVNSGSYWPSGSKDRKRSNHRCEGR